MKVTPVMEWKQDSSSDCSVNQNFCIEYPVEKLQQYDTELGSEFHIALSVYNKAGHFLNIDTKTFRLPSRYPPGHAFVWDIDPRDTKYAPDDVDVHFSSATLCAKWTGFRHHENITLEFAVGSNVKTDDVIPFKVIENVLFTCINSSRILPGVKYHALLRATCAGGKSVSASNGVTILTQSYVDRFLQIYVGENCQSLSQAKMNFQTNKNGETILNPSKPLKVGHLYNIYKPENITVEIVFGSGSLIPVQRQNFGNYYRLVPFVQHPNLKVLSAKDSNETNRIKVTRCPSKRYISATKQNVESMWHFITGNYFPVNFEVGIVKEDLNNSGLINSVAISSNLTRAKISIPKDARPGMPYRLAIRPCLHTYCLEPVKSKHFTILSNVIDGHISVASIDHEEDRTCFSVDLQWDAFTSDSPVMFYQWTLSEDTRGIIPVIAWTTIENTSRLQYQVSNIVLFFASWHFV